jgi:hypothetical protein
LGSHSIGPKRCMQHAGSLPRSQELSNCPYPEPRPVSTRSILMLSTHLRLGLHSGHLFPSDNVYWVLFFPIHATCHAFLILIDLIILILLGDEYKSCISSLCNFLHPPVTLLLIGPDIHLSTLFSNTLSLCSPRVSHPCHTHSEPTSIRNRGSNFALFATFRPNVIHQPSSWSF